MATGDSGRHRRGNGPVTGKILLRLLHLSHAQQAQQIQPWPQRRGEYARGNDTAHPFGHMVQRSCYQPPRPTGTATKAWHQRDATAHGLLAVRV